MRDRHPALHLQGCGAFGDQFDAERAERAALVQVDVHRHGVLLGEAEHHVQVPDRVAVQPAGVEPADHLGAGGQRVAEQGRHPGLEQHAGLRERHDGDVGAVRVRLLRGQHPVEPLQTAVGVHLRVRPEPGGPAGDRQPEGVGGALRDGPGVVTPVGPVVGDQLGQRRPGGVRTERQAEPGGVEVDVGVGERREQDPAAPVLSFRARRQRQAGTDLGNAARRSAARRRPGSPTVGRHGSAGRCSPDHWISALRSVADPMARSGGQIGQNRTEGSAMNRTDGRRRQRTGQRARRESRSASRMITLLPSSRSQPRWPKSASALLTVSREAPTSWASSSWVRSWVTRRLPLSC